MDVKYGTADKRGSTAGTSCLVHVAPSPSVTTAWDRNEPRKKQQRETRYESAHLQSRKNSILYESTALQFRITVFI